jgi:DNA polymerase III delta prime subunit
MSKINLTIAMAALTMMMITNCGEMKKAIAPCIDNKYETDKKFYRARFMGQSVLEEVAYEQAKEGAREELAAQIKNHVQRVNDRFLEEYHQNLTEDLKLKFVKFTRQIVDVVLYDSYIVCQAPYKQRKENYYKYWVVVEMSKEDFLNRMSQEISKDDELKIDFDMQNYEKTFDEIFNKE